MEFRGKVEVNPRFKAALLKLDRVDLMKILVEFDAQFRSDERRLFNTEGATGGEKWQALSSEYAKAKARRFSRGSAGASILTGQKILAATGRLRRSLTMARGRHLAFVSMTPPSLTVGAQSRIGGFHQAGAGRLPERDPMQQTRGQQLRLHKIVKDWIVQVKLKKFAGEMLRWRGSRGR